MIRTTVITEGGLVMWESGEKERFQKIEKISPYFEPHEHIANVYELNRDITVLGSQSVRGGEFSHWSVYRDLHGDHKWFDTFSEMLIYLETAVEVYLEANPSRDDGSWKLP